MTPSILVRQAVLVSTICNITATLALAQNGDLVAAAKNGDLVTVNQLLASGTDVNDRKFTIVGQYQSGDSTALMEASYRGYLEIVHALLAAKADVNATLSEKRDGETALTLAVQKGHVKIVEALLAAKADVNHPCCGVGALYDAVRANRPEMVKTLLVAKPDLNRMDPVGGRTALMYAIDSGRWDMARLLVAAGADVNRRSKNGFTPLLKIASSDSPGSLEMTQLLLAAHADPDFRDCSMSFMTPLGFASVQGNTDIVKALLASKADANLEQCDGKTPLMLALQNNQQEVAEVLGTAIAAAPAAK